MATAAQIEASPAISPEWQERLDFLEEMSKQAPPITINPRRMGGTPVIGIHRLPVVSLIEHLMRGYTVEEFLDSFPGTDPDKVMGVLQMVKEKLAEGWLAEQVDY